MALPPLVPRPRWPAALVVPAQQLLPTHKEWAAMHSEIERLYIRERRKLRYIMQYMEREHAFKATEQMYKKRFAKWGFQKNSRRSAAAVPTLMKDEGKKGASSEFDPPGELGSVPAFPGFAHDDGLMLMFLTSVRKCSMAFFEHIQSHHGILASQRQLPINQPWPEQTDKISFTFKLVMDLLDQGHGNLAGRMARKGFLLIEDMLTLEGPALVWNLLEMMHHMVALRHPQLFQMFLAHLTALIDGRMPKSHPISAMLRGLRGLVASLTSAVSTPRNSVSTLSWSSSGSPSPSSGSKTTTTAGPWLLSYSLASLLERGWTLNAEIVLDHFDPRLFSLYCHMHCNACSIAPPLAIVNTANEWVSNLEAQQASRLAAEARQAEGLLDITSIATDRLLQRLLAPRVDASPPRDYEMLRTSSDVALREYLNSILTKGSGDTTMLLRILAVLVTTTILEEWHAVIKPSSTASSVTTSISRVQAAKVAWAMRTLMDIKPEHRGDGPVPHLETVERIRSIVALREYAHAETDPEVVREMWLLVEALVAAGEYEEAQEVRQTAIRRLEKYVQDIPLNSA
ncbi:uncharacterized protein Z519_02038 [Cladophialophora bantiana CBS 173.52]|uniref:Clr5 domain-containing protein n=1 Tax=Cladophialophora bantiana (strain ATCC 10958 / CBS 173.52 / CDC B-1940 / NIH 8579) TaxID=1442370 RepID=A0A0D2GE41_CLAB1|nr:uncharacterized protein Z519_02038 [Cladophialophora bantiana CBS 173.52]KIW96647.1 hypothetical protein Z519_02038 [Cladophialophora bantiana CBS 173.52]